MKKLVISIISLTFIFLLPFITIINVQANSINTNFSVSNCIYRYQYPDRGSHGFIGLFGESGYELGSISRIGNGCESVRRNFHSIKPFQSGANAVTLVTCHIEGGYSEGTKGYIILENTFITGINGCPPPLTGIVNSTVSTPVESVTLYPSQANRYFHLSLCQVNGANSSNWSNIISRYALNNNPNPIDLCAGDPYRSIIEVPRVSNIYN